MTAALAFVLALCYATAAYAGVTPNNRPEIYCEFSSSKAPIDKDSVRMYVDGRDVTPLAFIQAWRVSYIPKASLPPGAHYVRVLVTDKEGHSGEKAWEFTVDPTALESAPLALEFTAPTPDNGDILTSGAGISAALRAKDPQQALPSPDALKTILLKDGAPETIGISTQWKKCGNLLVLAFPDLPSGHYAVRVSAEGMPSELTAAFTVDAEPPTIMSFAVEPAQIPAGGNFNAIVVFSDENQANINTCALAFHKKGSVVSEKTVRVSGPGRNQLLLQAADVEQKPGGVYSATIACTDTAGRTVEWDKPASFTIAVGPSQLAALDSPAARDSGDLFLHDPPRTTGQPGIDLTGRAPANAQLSLLVNSLPVVERQADGAGDFLFSNVSLSPGLNRISVAVLDDSGMPVKESRTVNVTYKIEPVAMADNPQTDITQPDTDEEPVIQEPDEPEPAIEEPFVEDPVVIEPEEPIIEEPVVEEPVVEDPVVEEPVTEEPVDPVNQDLVEEAEPPELTIRVSHGAGHGHAPIHAKAPPGLAVTLYHNGNPAAQAVANNGGQLHFKDIDLVTGRNDFQIAVTMAGVEYRSEIVTIMIEKTRDKDRK